MEAIDWSQVSDDAFIAEAARRGFKRPPASLLMQGLRDLEDATDHLIDAPRELVCRTAILPTGELLIAEPDVPPEQLEYEIGLIPYLMIRSLRRTLASRYSTSLSERDLALIYGGIDLVVNQLRRWARSSGATPYEDVPELPDESHEALYETDT